MTVSSQTIENQHAGPYLVNGATASFPFLFKVNSPLDVRVEIIDSLYNVTEVDPGDYTVFPSSEGGAVNFTSAPLPGAVPSHVWIYLDPSFEQQVQFENDGPIRAETLNTLTDQAAIRDIFQLSLIGRSLKLPFGETATDLPRLEFRRGRLLGFDKFGKAAFATVREILAAIGVRILDDGTWSLTGTLADDGGWLASSTPIDDGAWG